MRGLTGVGSVGRHSGRLPFAADGGLPRAVQLLAVALVVGTSLRAIAQESQMAREPETKKKAMYRVAGGARDGVSVFERVEYAQVKGQQVRGG